MAGPSMSFSSVRDAALSATLLLGQSFIGGHNINNVDVPRDTAHHIQVADTGIRKVNAEQRFGNFRVVLQDFDTHAIGGGGSGGAGGPAMSPNANA